MNCPYCDYYNSKVIDSRDVEAGIRRRRQCLRCNERFTTYERWQKGGLFVKKKDQRREEFSREKLLSGLHRACEKRPLPTGAVEKLSADIEAELFGLGKLEITTSFIGDMVMNKLKKIDYIAYIRFASVYRDFTDITDLKQEIDTLVSGVEDAALLAVSANQLPLMLDHDIGAGMTVRVKRKRRHPESEPNKGNRG
ncbi:transcriptional regulator NrdR [Chloroflexota bacterium]